MDVYPVRKALAIAEEQGLDLVEISPNAKPPVVKVMDYKKFLYEQKDIASRIHKSIFEAGGIVAEKMMEGKKKIAETTNNKEDTPKKE